MAGNGELFCIDLILQRQKNEESNGGKTGFTFYMERISYSAGLPLPDLASVNQTVLFLNCSSRLFRRPPRSRLNDWRVEFTAKLNLGLVPFAPPGVPFIDGIFYPKQILQVVIQQLFLTDQPLEFFCNVYYFLVLGKPYEQEPHSSRLAWVLFYGTFLADDVCITSHDQGSLSEPSVDHFLCH